MIKYIVVRIKENVKVIFEDEFINGNEFRTQNEIIEVLNLLYKKGDFSVELYSKELEKRDNRFTRSNDK